MTFDEYKTEVYCDGKDFIKDNFDSYDEYEDFENLYEDMQYTVTGNDNGSYYCDYWCAQQAVKDIPVDKSTMDELASCYGSEWIADLIIDNNMETLDVLVRDLALGYVCGELKKYFEAIRENDMEEE